MKDLRKLLIKDLDKYQKEGYRSVPKRSHILAMSMVASRNLKKSKFIFIPAHCEEANDQAQSQAVFDIVEDNFKTESALSLLIEWGDIESDHRHYYAAKFEFLPDGSCSFLVLDYTDSDGSRLASFPSIAKDHGHENVHSYNLMISDGSIRNRKLQQDRFSCAFFALDALLQLDGRTIASICPQKEKSQIDWLDLPHQLIHNAQSVEAIFNYVSQLVKKFKHSISKDLPALMGEDGRTPGSLASYIDQGLEVNKEGEAKELHVRNDAIQKNIIQPLALATREVVKIINYSVFIDLVYPESVYPNINLFLKNYSDENNAEECAFLYKHEVMWENFLSLVLKSEFFQEFVLAKIIPINFLLQNCVENGVYHNHLARSLAKNESGMKFIAVLKDRLQGKLDMSDAAYFLVHSKNLKKLFTNEKFIQVMQTLLTRRLLTLKSLDFKALEKIDLGKIEELFNNKKLGEAARILKGEHNDGLLLLIREDNEEKVDLSLRNDEEQEEKLEFPGEQAMLVSPKARSYAMCFEAFSSESDCKLDELLDKAIKAVHDAPLEASIDPREAKLEEMRLRAADRHFVMRSGGAAVAAAAAAAAEGVAAPAADPASAAAREAVNSNKEALSQPA